MKMIGAGCLYSFLFLITFNGQILAQVTAFDDIIETNEDVPVVVNVQLNDINAGLGELHTTIISAPVNGVIVLLAGDSISYTPNENFSGPDNFTYQVTNDDIIPASGTAVVYVTIIAQPDYPLAFDDFDTTDVEVYSVIDVQANDINVDPEFLQTQIILPPLHGTSSVIGGISIEYMPEVDFFGDDSLLYAVCNADYLTFCDTAVAYIRVNAVNLFPPDLINDYATIPVGTDTTLNILANDTDGDGDVLYVSEIHDPGITGTVILNSDYTISYASALPAIDTMIYIACDINSPSYCDTALIVINVVTGTDTSMANDLIIPNSFSPNGDGLNDYFVIQNLDRYTAFNLNIYNRWGDLVFENSDINTVWGGQVNVASINKAGSLPQGTYFYLLQVDGISEPLQGYIEMRR